MMTPVYLVDDDQDVLESLQWMLKGQGIEAVGFDCAASFLDGAAWQLPGVLVLDVQMPGMDGISLHQQLLQASSPLAVIILTGHGNIAMAVKAMQQGAMDFLEKPVDGDRLLELLSKGAALTAQRFTVGSEQAEIRSRLATLTPREREVMQRVLAGKLNKVIAAELYVTQRTVELHRKKVLEKMAVHNVAELAFLLAKLQPLPS
ncbi:DNA-binding response regulator [Shewanella carassii]|uniref:response regulator transcription factor n=1 Tax=Shewanella carassii TaxID=1987584 RepID=UPI001BF118CB|nr:DNA-binding response regulator [Shewanella carassii]